MTGGLPSARVMVRLTPRASRNEIKGWEGETLRIAVTAPPVEGKANAALLRFLARALDIPRRRIILERGEKGRNKVVRIEGLGIGPLRTRLSEGVK